MRSSFKSVRATIKIAAVYAFALSTAVACSKFELAVPKIAKGTASATSVPTPGSAIPALNATTLIINNLIRTNYGVHNPVTPKDYAWSFEMNVTHGQAKPKFLLTPQYDETESTIAEGEFTIENVKYVGQVGCADMECRNVVFLLTATNMTDNTTFQIAQYWDMQLNTSAPLKTMNGSSFPNAKLAYYGLTGELLK